MDLHYSIYFRCWLSHQCCANGSPWDATQFLKHVSTTLSFWSYILGGPALVCCVHIQACRSYSKVMVNSGVSVVLVREVLSLTITAGEHVHHNAGLVTLLASKLNMLRYAWRLLEAWITAKYLACSEQSSTMYCLPSVDQCLMLFHHRFWTEHPLGLKWQSHRHCCWNAGTCTISVKWALWCDPGVNEVKSRQNRWLSSLGFLLPSFCGCGVVLKRL